MPSKKWWLAPHEVWVLRSTAEVGDRRNHFELVDLSDKKPMEILAERMYQGIKRLGKRAVSTVCCIHSASTLAYALTIDGPGRTACMVAAGIYGGFAVMAHRSANNDKAMWEASLQQAANTTT